jgi:hypothetical protein
VVTTALGPRIGVWERRTAGGIAAPAGPAGPAAAVIVFVVALVEEPDQPQHERADVEDAQPDHEDPPGQCHYKPDPTPV